MLQLCSISAREVVVFNGRLPGVVVFVKTGICCEITVHIGSLFKSQLNFIL